MYPLAVVIAFLSLLANVYLILRIRQGQLGIDTLNKLTRDIATAKRHREEIERDVQTLKGEADKYAEQIELGGAAIGALEHQRYEAEEKLKSAQLLASKELELQNERLKA